MHPFWRALPKRIVIHHGHIFGREERLRNEYSLCVLLRMLHSFFFPLSFVIAVCVKHSFLHCLGSELAVPFQLALCHQLVH